MNELTINGSANRGLKNNELFLAEAGSTAVAEQKPERPRAIRARTDQAFSFAMRGGALNSLVDSTAELLALVLRVSDLGQYDDVDELHKRCRHEIEAVELETHRLGYDRVTVLALRYCLCSVIDEAVMNSPWGQVSSWSERSLLALFHDETWGGEKFFVILERLMMEPSRYLQIIEFLYLCLCLGYEGRYRPVHNGRAQLEALIKEVHDVIRKERGPVDPLMTLRADHIVDRAHHMRWQTPIAAVIASALALAVGTYLGFFFYTEHFTNGIIAELTQVLRG
ncbi:type IVB secretion system protein IcmH/DotU [Neorhizobium sp. T786]|uniref:type IVB secretion system protein IcmH/DotU n=1 Tax=Pseudorhizobium xiangyangii TaxID=2883104 RepID=UPI001CFFA396|nr:type IVB secretion system protein IcmH/DotU [Neorhizobium xiangyangii]MCB5205269.1 type IVB secretion system protein IcmH/DotU [Neorhizobium xiangyangii]